MQLLSSAPTPIGHELMTLTGASDLRQIPDAQEVFLEQESDISYIFEVLDRVEPSDPVEAAKYVALTKTLGAVLKFIRFHFDSIAHDSSAQSSEVLDVDVPQTQQQSPPNTPVPIILRGQQKVAKFNRVELDTVNIFLAVYRLTEKPHDIVFVVNIPVSGPSTVVQNVEKIKQNFSLMANSLRIVDFDLFAS